MGIVRATLFLTCLLTTTASYALDPRADIEKAVELLGKGEYTLARTYLNPAVIAPYLSSGERSRAYYLRGFAWGAERLFVSARKDYNRALEFNANNPAALVELGRLHLAGKGIDADAGLAFSLFEKAAELDYAPARFHMGYAYLLGEGVEKNLLKAREILGAAAEEGHPFAMMSLASSYRQDYVTSPEPDVARDWYEKAHAAGEPKALLSLAYMYNNGELGEANPERGFQLLKQAADEGVVAAFVPLGYAYLTGSGTSVDEGAALAAYQRGAEAGEVPSYLALGHLYEHGVAVERDLAQARVWYERGARLGHVDAQMRLVGFFLRKDGPEARREALYWGAQAAKSGSALARNDYAWLLATTRFDEMRNGTLALDQARKAVELNESAVYLDTLAAAYAEIGNFEEAVATQLRALELLTEEQMDLKGELEQRLASYRRSQPWRE